MNKKVAIGLLGTTLDRGASPKRWEQWRPTVSLHQHNDLLLDRYHMLYQARFKELAELIKTDINLVSPATKVILEEIELGDPWDFESVFGSLYDYAAGYDFDPEKEDYYIHITTGSHVAQICLFLLTESHHLPAKLIQTSPVNHRRHDPIGTYSITNLDLSRYDQIAMRFNAEIKNDIEFLKSNIKTQNPQFNDLIAMIEKVAMRSQEPLLLTGATGAGKSQLAKRIYELKKNNFQISGRFVEVNCATLRGDSAISTLFGHKKGAFTGAATDRHGLLKEADQGILFLDEVGELGLDEQAMLLHAIEEKTFYPLGSDRQVESSFQLICGTNQDLKKAVTKGTFREDLLARINLWHFELPGLNERREDIAPNIDYELSQITRKTGERVTFNHEAREKFTNFATSPEAIWKANFRDLNAAITRMSTLAERGRIKKQTVEAEIKRLKVNWQSATAKNDDLSLLLGKDAKDKYDRFDLAQLADVIKVCRQSNTLSEAGRKLFAVSRESKAKPNDADRLKKYLNRFGLNWLDIKN